MHMFVEADVCLNSSGTSFSHLICGIGAWEPGEMPKKKHFAKSFVIDVSLCSECTFLQNRSLKDFTLKVLDIKCKIPMMESLFSTVTGHMSARLHHGCFT